MEQVTHTGEQPLSIVRDRAESWTTAQPAQSTFNGNRHLPQPQDTQNLDYQHSYGKNAEQLLSLALLREQQCSWTGGAGRGKKGLQVTSSQAGRTAFPFSYSPASSGESHIAVAGTTKAAHWCKCLESHWGLCEGFVYGTKSQCSRAGEWRDKYSVASNLISHTSSKRKARLCINAA